MSDPGASTLGKRARKASSGGVDDGEAGPAIPDMPGADVEDSSDEEIGPVPVPEGAGNGETSNGKRKKKKPAGES